MKNPFKKNNPEEEAAGQEGEQQGHKKTKLKISLKNFIVRESDEDAEEAAKAKAEKKAERERLKEEKRKAKAAKKSKEEGEDAPAETKEEPPADGQPEEAGAEEKPEKKKTEKPEKIKRERGSGKKGPPVILFIIIGVVAGAGVMIAVLLFTGDRGPTVEERLIDAAGLAATGDYVASHAVYQELLTEDETLVAAYLGQADNYVKEEDIGSAIDALTLGFELTEDPAIEARLGELTAEREAEAAMPTEPPSPPIVWQDKALEAMVRMALGVTADAPVTEADAAKVTSLKIVGSTHAVANGELHTENTLEGYTIDGEFYSERGEIASLADLRYFTGLTKLTVCYNQVSDLTGLEPLAGLGTLGLYCNAVSDLSPLAGLSNLRYAYLYGNEIADLSPLSGLSGLAALYLQNNGVADLSPLSGLSSLRELYLNNNEITDISVVAGLTELRSFYARNNQIADFSPIWNLPALTDTGIDGNPADAA